MHLDVQDLRNFYYRSTLGRAAQASIRTRMLELWPEAKGQTVAGFGFALPVLRPYLPQGRRVIALMPAQQGVIAWPTGMPNVSVLTEETQWPIETGHIDKLVVMHGLEGSEHPSQLLDECWRVLGPGGRAIFIVPSRGGLWSRNEATPFGHGQPYTPGQLEALLKQHRFVPEAHSAALYQPPSTRRFWLKSRSVFERLGRGLPSVVAGGVVMIEVSKRVQAPTGTGVKEPVRRPARALKGVTKPA